MNSLEEKRKARFKFLNLLYEKTGGDRHLDQNMWELGQELGFDKDLTSTVTQYLEGEMLLEHTSIGGGIGITHYGVKEVETAILHPDQPTQYFPAVNIINIHNMVGSNIQQGTTSSNITSSYKANQLDDLATFIEKLKATLPEISLSSDDKNEIETDIATIETQTSSSRPKHGIIKESLCSIQRILEGAAGSILAQQLVQSLPLLINNI
jgi:hypothetical protein